LLRDLCFLTFGNWLRVLLPLPVSQRNKPRV
jgi:hypothetical protein